jgi:hypothetical protein
VEGTLVFETEPMLEQSENVCRFNTLRIKCKGRTNTVDAEPEPVLEALVVLVPERIVLLELIGRAKLRTA